MLPKPLFRTRLPVASNGRFVIVGLVRLAKLTVLLTPVNWVWLSALKASSRTSILTRWPAARPAVDARDLPVVGQDAERAARDLGRLVDEVDHEVVRTVLGRVRVVGPADLRVADVRPSRGEVVVVDGQRLAPHVERREHE